MPIEKRKINVFNALLVLTTLPALAAAQDFDNIQITTIPVRDNIYMLQGSGGNIGVSIGEDGVIIVDDQFAPLTGKIQAAIGALTNLPVTYVINSHFHYDHSDGNENFGSAGATIIAHDNARRRMQSTQMLASGRPQEPYDKVGLPSVTLFDVMNLYFNDNQVELIALGKGHTDGDVQVYFVEPNVIHTGDVFVRYGLPFIDTSNGGGLDDMIEGVWALSTVIDDDTIIIPGHGALATRNDLLAYHEMLITIRSNLVRARIEGMTPQQMVDSEPAADYAPANDNTRQWLLRHYAEYE